MQTDSLGDAIANYINGYMTLEEKRQFEALMAEHPELKAEFELQKDIAVAVRRIERDKLRSKIKQVASQSRKYDLDWMKIAASFALVIALGALGSYYFNSSPTNQIEYANINPSKKPPLQDALQNMADSFEQAKSLNLVKYEVQIDDTLNYIIEEINGIQLIIKPSGLELESKYSFGEKVFTLYLSNQMLDSLGHVFLDKTSIKFNGLFSIRVEKGRSNKESPLTGGYVSMFSNYYNVLNDEKIHILQALESNDQAKISLLIKKSKKVQY